MPAESDLDYVTVDIGKPIRGLFYGSLLIAGTMGSVFLWDNYQGRADSGAAVMTAQSR